MGDNLTPQQRYYRRNRAKCIARAQARHDPKAQRERYQVGKLFFALYAGGECAHCELPLGEPMRNFHFHHIGEKLYDIGHILRSKDVRRTLAEVDKCILLCVKCHARVHYEDATWMNNH